MRVVIAPNEPAPAGDRPRALFVRKPAPPAEPIDPSSAKGIAVAAATDMTAAVANAKVGKITAERAAELQKLPISVLVSKADGKVIVRHGFRPVFEAPVVIRDPERPLGTHVYTALEFKDGGDAMRWQAVSVPRIRAERRPTRARSRAPRAARPSRRSGGQRPAVDRPPRRSTASSCRRRRVDRISEMLSPGASLIISDHGHNREMRAVGHRLHRPDALSGSASELDRLCPDRIVAAEA